MHLNPFVWALIGVFVVFFQAGAVIIGIDVWLYKTSRKTISRHTIELLYRYPGPVACVLCLLTGTVCLSLGALIGHLCFPQATPSP